MNIKTQSRKKKHTKEIGSEISDKKPTEQEQNTLPILLNKPG
ncbi:hypothetical protein AALB_4009 [Agarivorans albus MKT 106]|uniref:Uncharacterized protein n=1 Tax=Agarivorans albus MKT 106 TaxID=1331007 RepID=R9PRE6_AGAAL|nr:hypothetical protein AALB_4009 [Agarivorans albus MKT 106]